MPITVYIRPLTLNDQLVYNYTFRKNLPLFKWLLGLSYFKYDRIGKMLYTDAKEEILDFIEIASMGRLSINKTNLYRDYVVLAQNEPQSGLTRIEVPKHQLEIKITVKAAIIENVNYYLLATEQINKCKELLLPLEVVHYSQKLSVFLMPMLEVNILRLLTMVKGKILVSLHQHVKLQSLFLQSCLWNQTYQVDVVVPPEYLKHLKSKNYSPNTIQNYYSSFSLICTIAKPLVWMRKMSFRIR